MANKDSFIHSSKLMYNTQVIDKVTSYTSKQLHQYHQSS